MIPDLGLISVIMAAYNAEKTIEQAITSVLNQTYTNWELIVVNDCSKDNTVGIVQKLSMQDSRICLLHNPQNSGVSYTRWHGLEAARGEWIAILDSDDAWASDKLEKQVELQKEKHADLLYTGSIFMDAEGRHINWYLGSTEKRLRDPEF